jgi:hypothetical protein
VFLSGKPDIDNTPTMREKQKANQKIIVFEIELLGSAQRTTETQQAQSQAQTGTAQAQPESSEEPDDLPF